MSKFRLRLQHVVLWPHQARLLMYEPREVMEAVMEAVMDHQISIYSAPDTALTIWQVRPQRADHLSSVCTSVLCPP